MELNSNMNKCKICGKEVYKRGVCVHHYNSWVRRIDKIIDAKIREDQPYRPTHLREKREMGY